MNLLERRSAMIKHYPGGQCGDNAFWIFNTDTGKLTVSGTGALYDYTSTSTPWRPYRTGIVNVTVNDGITSLGTFFIRDSKYIDTIRIPQSVTSFTGRCFVNSKADKVRFGGTLAQWLAISADTDDVPYGRLFIGGAELTAVTVPAQTENIRFRAFSGCANLTSVTFAGTPVFVDTTAFAADTSLSDIYVPWSEGEIAGAPWGAANATVHYNTVQGENV